MNALILGLGKDAMISDCIRQGHRLQELKEFIKTLPDDVPETWCIIVSGGHGRLCFAAGENEGRMPALLRAFGDKGWQMDDHQPTKLTKEVHGFTIEISGVESNRRQIDLTRFAAV